MKVLGIPLTRKKCILGGTSFKKKVKGTFLKLNINNAINKWVQEKRREYKYISERKANIK